MLTHFVQKNDTEIV